MVHPLDEHLLVARSVLRAAVRDARSVRAAAATWHPTSSLPLVVPPQESTPAWSAEQTPFEREALDDHSSQGAHDGGDVQHQARKHHGVLRDGPPLVVVHQGVGRQNLLCRDLTLLLGS